MSEAGGTGVDRLRYTRVAIALHWTIAALVIVNLLLGLLHEDFERPVRASMMFFHKSIGMTVLGLTIVRLLWRLGHRPPPMDPAIKRWEKALAHIVHFTFYLLLIGIPMTGWLLSSTGGRDISFFGVVDIPPLPVRGEDAHDIFEERHELLATIMIGLILLHIAGALKHQLQGHRVIGRMAP